MFRSALRVDVIAQNRTDVDQVLAQSRKTDKIVPSGEKRRASASSEFSERGVELPASTSSRGSNFERQYPNHNFLTQQRGWFSASSFGDAGSEPLGRLLM
jgi:hypothetical protein